MTTAQTKLLRNVLTGVVFPTSATLEQQPWMEPYEPKAAVNVIKEEKTESIKIKSAPRHDEIEEKEEEVPFVKWEVNSDDGPVYRALVKMANHKQITMVDINDFNPGVGDFKEKFNPVAVKSAVSEFKTRALNGE